MGSGIKFKGKRSDIPQNKMIQPNTGYQQERIDLAKD
jgi:hypothetical protein